MPMKDGFETMSEMAETFGKQNMPVVIACTGYTDEENIQKCFDYGMDDYIEKPIDRTKFEGLVMKYLMKKKPSSSPRNGHDVGAPIQS
jgi:CheY-like chemotaxis protein